MYSHKVTDETINFLKQASLAEQSNLYYKLKLKHRISVQNIWFNQQCIKNGVNPKFVHIRCSSTTQSAKKAIQKAKTTWLKEESRRWFKTRDNLLLHIKVLHSELTFKLHSIEFDFLDDKVRSEISVIIHKKYINQSKKLKKLIHDKNKTVQNLPVQESKKFFDRVINLSETQFTETEINLLEKGPKYNPPTNHLNIETLIAEVEISLTNHLNTDNLVKEQITSVIKNSTDINNVSKKHTPEELTVRSIQKKVKENNLSVTRADKGNSIVILTQDQYNNKVQDFLNKEKPVLLKKDPTEKVQNELKQTLKNNGIFSDREKYFLVNKNPSPPILYGLAKIHKQETPIRPVVSYSNTPLRQIAVKLNNMLRNLTNFKPKYSVKNSIDLSVKLKNITLPENTILASFDVSNMFSNIPNEECVKIITKKLKNNNVNPVIEQEILELLTLCINGNYFKFQDQFYKQTDGLAMGSPLSPLLAEMFMSDFEESFLNTPQSGKILFWYRYVDDILVGFTGDKNELGHILYYLNSIHPKIKFTLETEENNSINFLDLKIVKTINTLSFDIYRKPTFTDSTIPYDSLHPNTHKMAAYRSMVHRALSIPLSKENLERELGTIKAIAASNGYKSHTIDLIIKKKQRQLVMNNIYPQTKVNSIKTYIPLTYFGPLSNKISNLISTENNKIAFKSSNRLSNLLFNVKDKQNKFKKSGVYKIDCEECSSLYIGQTGRNFETRFKEHYASYRLKKRNSNFANHFLDTNHSFPNVNNLKILHVEQKGRKLDVLENIEIYKNKHNSNVNLLNTQIDLGTSPLLSLLHPNIIK